MANRPCIIEATPANFKTLVLENSDKGPVMDYFWSPCAGPCMKLMPGLIGLADEYCGKYLLVLLDTHTVHGAESDAEFRRVIDKFLTREASVAQINALRAYQQGDLEQAGAQLARAANDEPDNPRIALDLAKVMILEGDYDKAEAVLLSMPVAAREDAEISNLLTEALH